MAQTTNKLSALKVQRVTKPGLYGDGGNLYLRVSDTGAKYWIMRFMMNGKPRVLGIGQFPLFSLAEARERAIAARKLKADGIDPIAERKARKAGASIAAAKSMSFQQCADAYIEAHASSWSSAKHAKQWGNTLATYAGPIIGALPVAAIDTALVMKVLEQKLPGGGTLWTSKAETASRLRGRIESVLDWAKVRGYRADGENNPARLRGHIDHLLPARNKAQAVEHHDALPYAEMPEFMAALGEVEGIPARALEFTILTCVRSGEARGATWGEFSLTDWTIPSSRMKVKSKEHRVPLSERVLEILAEMRFGAAEVDSKALVFPSTVRGKALSDKTLLNVLRALSSSATVHGMRSTFRQWVDEQTSFDSSLAELSLAHTVGSKVELAYRRGDGLEKRRSLMKAWCDFCRGRPGATVVAFPVQAA